MEKKKLGPSTLQIYSIKNVIPPPVKEKDDINVHREVKLFPGGIDIKPDGTEAVGTNK